MELPNYSRQLMQQLHALRREGQFCDCTILVGESLHRAHKLVLAASSLLFRSLLEGSDSISIDPALVTSQEFSSLLEMAYTGRLPPGKHNFTRIIAAADSLQMFDLAVSCKNILTNLMKQPPDTPGLSPVTTPQCLPAAVFPDVEKDPLKGPREAIGQTNTEAEGCRGEDARNIIQQVEQTATEDGKGSACEKHHQESPGRTGSRAGAEFLEFLSHSRDKIAEAIGDLQLWVKAMEMWERISSVERQVILDCGKKDPGTPSVFYKLLNCVTEGGSLSPHTLLTLLELLKEYHPKLAPLLQEPAEQEDSTNRGPAAGMSVEERSESDVPLLTHSVELIDLLSDISFLTDSLIIAANSCLEEREREVVYEVCRDRTPREAAEQLLKQVWEEGTVSEGSLHKLLRTLHKSSPGLQLLLEGTQTSTDTAADKPDEARLLRKYRSRLLEWVYDPQNLLLTLEAITGFPAEERECIQGFLKQSSGAQCLDRIVSLALEGSSLSALSVWRLLFRAAAQNSWLEMLTGEVREEPGAEKLIQSVMDSESLHLDILLKHKSLILENVRDLGALESVKDPGSMAEELTEFIQTCREGFLCLSMKDILGQILEEKSLSAQPFCMMLSMNRQSFPQLLPLFSDLEQAEKEAELKGVQMSGALEGTDVGKERGGAKQCFCQWCGKAFAFRCRMEVHRRRCPLSRESSHRCPRCPQELATPRALQQHLAQAHEGPARKKRKRQELVTCDLCEKTFAHPSGMLYHKRTDHFDEKPYACEECGAKFAANSSLKNHVRLHTGERPFHCKHCDMSFSQAAALSYHTKKKHSEGKMYACQYCEALFAQSIELTRHVRTHTGDKPYVCRECGKGFSQANGLSVHLHTFHNIADPHDCQKCRMSFASLEEHRKHIQECHPKEYHQCDKCKKIFNSDALLEKHAVIHVGGKPHSCKICHKAYQQLSGLWYHNRTTHPEVFAGQSHRLLKSLFQCMACDKAFSSSTSLAKHEKSEHPEKVFKCDDCEQQFTESDLLVAHKKENHSGSFHTAAEVQLHLCNQHFSQEGEVSGCAHCDLLFPSQLELQEHFLSKHHDVLSENSQVSTSQMVIQTEEPSGGTEEVITLDQSQLGCSQVYVALGDSESSTSGAEIVAVNMEDLLDGTVTFICGESQ